MNIKDIATSPEKQRIFDMVLEEAARQWCDGMTDAPEKTNGEGFAEFFYEVFEQKEKEYQEPFACENCMYYNTENWTCQNKNSPFYQKDRRCDDTCMEQES